MLRKYGFRLDKRLGQHFLVDERVLARIVEVIVAFGASRVVELGAGAGALTARLAEAGQRVDALELDERMCTLLTAEMPPELVQVERADIAKDDLAARVGEAPMVFAGNLPYQVTSPVLFALLPAFTRPAARGAVLMMQAEVAERLRATPGGKEYGILSVLVGARARVRKLFDVAPASFLPPPRVRSAVVELRPRTDPVDLGVSGTALVKSLFSQRRKQIGGLLRRGHGLSPSELERLESELRLDPHRRAESMQLEEFVRLDGWLCSRGGER